MWPRIGLMAGVLGIVAASFVGLGRTGGAIVLAVLGGMLLVLSLAALSPRRPGGSDGSA